jgi:hypothetical protein
MSKVNDIKHLNMKEVLFLLPESPSTSNVINASLLPISHIFALGNKANFITKTLPIHPQ